MTALAHTPAEKLLIEALDGAEGWRAAARQTVLERGLPTKRDEAWKWSDLRRATGRMDQRGAASFNTGPALTLSDGQAFDLLLEASAGVSTAELTVSVPAGQSAILVERHDLAAGAFVSARIHVALGEGSRLERIVIADIDADAIPVVRNRIDLAAGAIYRQTVLTFGSKLSRHEIHITHAGEGAEAHLGGVYLLDEGRHADFTSTITHTGPGGITKQLVKGAAAAHAQGVFQGKFKVEQAAQQTDAKMTHRALMLDERAEIDAKPELEIYADDVQCAHGNALGAIDETALFYMRQRGLTEARARALLIESFLAEPLDMISSETLRDSLKSMLRQRLEAMS